MEGYWYSNWWKDVLFCIDLWENRKWSEAFGEVHAPCRILVDDSAALRRCEFIIFPFWKIRVHSSHTITNPCQYGVAFLQGSGLRDDDIVKS